MMHGQPSIKLVNISEEQRYRMTVWRCRLWFGSTWFGV